MLTRTKRKLQIQTNQVVKLLKTSEPLDNVSICSPLEFFNGVMANSWNESSAVIDLRPSKEFENSHVVHSISIPLSTIPTKPSQINVGSKLLQAVPYSQYIYFISSQPECDSVRINKLYRSILDQGAHNKPRAFLLSSFDSFCELFPDLLVIPGMPSYHDLPSSLDSTNACFPSMIQEWGLFLGSFSMAQDVTLLSLLQIDVIINVARECKHDFESGDTKKKKEFYSVQQNIPLSFETNQSTSHQLMIDYHKFHCVDSPDEKRMTEMWKQTCLLIEDCRKSKKRVLVHCALGRSRSASAILFYLMQQCRLLPYQKAFRYLKDCRPEVNVDNFSLQLEEFVEMK
jgi:rhodanese-related sulfurtransferase